ncbi:MAG: septation protein SpoVG family protein [Planctomycetota bacterium]|jgi:DNA-binding cell septation regulator SpoVG
MPSEIEVTEVRIRLPKEDKGNLIAWASCLICGGLILNNIQVLRGSDGTLGLSFPSRSSRGGRAMHFFYAVNRRTRAVIEKAIFEEYAAETGSGPPGGAEGREG